MPLSLAPLTLDQCSLFQKQLKSFPPEISEHTFTNLYVWLGYRPIFWAEYQESLLVFTRDDSGSQMILFGPPVGPTTVEELLYDGIITAAERLPETAVAALGGRCTVASDPDNYDYVYRTEDLAGLTGRKYAKKRNLVKQCLQGHHCVYEEITRANIEECIDLQHRWCALRQCSEHPMLAGEANAALTAFQHFDRLQLIGGAIRVDGTIEAYAVAEELSPDVAVCHFEKAMPHVPGLGQLINHWFAANALMDFNYINREQDLGIKGLRQAKKSYHPCHMVEKYTLEP